MTDRELMQQSLDALEGNDLGLHYRTIEALRAALAQPAPAVPAVQIGMKASTWETLSSDAQTLILKAGQRAVDKTKARRVTDAAARAMTPIPLGGSAAPAVPAPFDRTTALVLLQAASKSGDPGAISLAAQLAGAAPCTDCGYVNFKCRCADPAVPAVREPHHSAFEQHLIDRIETLMDALHICREYPDFDGGGAIPDMLDAVLAGRPSKMLEQLRLIRENTTMGGITGDSK